MGLFFLINEHFSLDLYKGRNKNISDDKSTSSKSTYLRHIVYGHAEETHFEIKTSSPSLYWSALLFLILMIK
jgi:hypothetical protein